MFQCARELHGRPFMVKTSGVMHALTSLAPDLTPGLDISLRGSMDTDPGPQHDATALSSARATCLTVMMS